MEIKPKFTTHFPHNFQTLSTKTKQFLSLFSTNTNEVVGNFFFSFQVSMSWDKIILTQEATMVFKYFFLSFMFIEWLISLHDLYSLFVRPLFLFIFATRTTACAAAARPRERARATEPCCVENGPGKKKALGVNPKVVMERLGTFWDPDDQRESIGSEEVVGLFVEDEPSLGEVKEAFCVFDKNNDGYIDAKELQNVLSDMGFLRVSESDCERMIVRYDVDKDGKISFREFLKVMEDGFCES